MFSYKRFVLFFLILSIVDLPLHAMDGEQNPSSFSRAFHWAQDHPLITVFGSVLIGSVIFKELIIDAPGRRTIEGPSSLKNPNLQLAQELLKKKGYLEQVDQDGNTPLYYAVSEGHTDKVRLFLKNRARITPSIFSEVIKTDNVEIAQLLISYGADINKICSYSTHHIEDGQDTMVVKFPQTALMFAIDIGSVTMIQLLLRNNADVFVKANGVVSWRQHKGDVSNELPVGNTAISIAAFSENTNCVRTIIQQSPFSPNKKPDDYKVTLALAHVCRQYNVPKVLHALILSHAPQYIPNRYMFQRVFEYCECTQELIENCPLHWFKMVYDNSEEIYKKSSLCQLSEHITDYRMQKVAQLLSDPKLECYKTKIFATAPILALIDPTQIEQHRQSIKDTVEHYFTTRPYIS